MAVTYNLLPGEGDYTFIGSSLGNDAYMAAAYDVFATKTGKDAVSDVIGTVVMNYYNVKPSGNGVDAVHINITLPNGSIPNMLVAKMC